MNIQRSVILALTAALIFLGIEALSGSELYCQYPERLAFVQFQMLAGALMVVQGFDTFRFLGEKYSPEVRELSVRNARLISGAIYVVTVILLLPVVQHMDLVHVRLSEIVDVLNPLAIVLPIMLMAAVLISQFNAAVADTGGGGGLLHESSNDRVSPQIGNFGVVTVAIIFGVDARTVRDHSSGLSGFRKVLPFPNDPCHHLQLQGLSAPSTIDDFQ